MFDALRAAAALAVAGWIGTGLAVEAERLRLPPPPPGADPGARLASWLSLRRVTADRRWIEVLQYCGDPAFEAERGRRLAGLVRRVTDADPDFEHVYGFGAAMLTWSCERTAEASALLARGLARHPGHPRMSAYLAAFAYERAGDLAGQAVALERIVEDPAAPFVARRILANLRERQGRIRLAAEQWAWVLAWSEDAAERAWAAEKCRKYGLDPEVLARAVRGR
jgi:hypothetical protein